MTMPSASANDGRNHRDLTAHRAPHNRVPDEPTNIRSTSSGSAAPMTP
jgi:hypothetical protein